MANIELSFPRGTERTLRDENGKTSFDYMKEKMRYNRMNAVSKPVVPITNVKGNVRHQPLPQSISQCRRWQSVNHQTLTFNNL